MSSSSSSSSSSDPSWKDVERTEPILNRDIKIRTLFGALLNMNLTGNFNILLY